MANFSFDYGNAHWTVLDSNPYVDWTDRDFRTGSSATCAAPGGDLAVRRFHHPGFNSSKEHFGEQQMRILAADLRSRRRRPRLQRPRPQLPAHLSDAFAPLRRTAKADDRRGRKAAKARHVDGNWTLDKSFDGKTDTLPKESSTS